MKSDFETRSNWDSLFHFSIMDIHQLPDIALAYIFEILSIDKYNCKVDYFMSRNIKLMGGEKKSTPLCIYSGIPLGRLVIDHDMQIVKHSFYLRGRHTPFYSSYALEAAIGPNRRSSEWKLTKRDTSKRRYCISGEFLQAKYNDEQNF